MQLPPTPSSARRARARTATFLAEGNDTWDIDRAALVVSELVANAVQHGVAPIRLRVELNSMLRIEVEDGDRDGLVDMRPVATDAPGGRGLHIVDALADKWGARLEEHGKTVWAELQKRDSG